MRLTGSLAYTRPTPTPKMPPGLIELIEGLAKDVLKSNPSDVYEFCAGHMQELLEIRDGPTKKYMSLEQKISRAQEKIRQRAEQRRQKYDQEMQILEGPHETLNSNGNEHQTFGKTCFTTPIHQELDLVDSSEIEISHFATSPDIQNNDKDEQIVLEIKERNDTINDEKQADITRGDITSTIKSVVDLNSDKPVIDEIINTAIENCESTNNNDEIKTDDSILSSENELNKSIKENLIAPEIIHTESHEKDNDNTQLKLDETELDRVDIFINESDKKEDFLPEHDRKPRNTNNIGENVDSQHPSEICNSYNQLDMDNKVIKIENQIIDDKSTLRSKETVEDNITISQEPFGHDINVVKTDKEMTTIDKKLPDEKTELLSIETFKKHPSNKAENDHNDAKQKKEHENVDQNNTEFNPIKPSDGVKDENTVNTFGDISNVNEELKEIENKNKNQIEANAVDTKSKSDKNEETETKTSKESNNYAISQEIEIKKPVVSKELIKSDCKSESNNKESEIKTLTENDNSMISQEKEIQEPVISQELNKSHSKSESNNEDIETKTLTKNDNNEIPHEKEIQESVVIKQLNKIDYKSESNNKESEKNTSTENDNNMISREKETQEPFISKELKKSHFKSESKNEEMETKTSPKNDNNEISQQKEIQESVVSKELNKFVSKSESNNKESETKTSTENDNNMTSHEKEIQEPDVSKELNKSDSKSESNDEESGINTLTENDNNMISHEKELQEPVLSKELSKSVSKSESNQNEKTKIKASTDNNINVTSQEKEVQEPIFTKEFRKPLNVSPRIYNDNNSPEADNIIVEPDNEIKLNIDENTTGTSEDNNIEISSVTTSQLAESTNNECFNETESKSNIEVATPNLKNSEDDLIEKSSTNNENPVQFDTKLHANVDTAQNADNPVGMDLETAAITIQKVFRSFLFKSRASTFEDSANDENNLSEENNETKDEDDLPFMNTNKERRAHGISRMDTVLQTVNEEKSLSLSTDDSSTLSSAATTIQAHVRGFLVRNKLNSNKTISSNSLVNSDGTSTTSQDNDGENKNKTILNIHIVPEGGHYLSRDESMITSMDLPLDGSPPSSINLHPLGYDKSEPRKQLKREDAIQSISPPSNNSGKLSEDIDSVKEMVINDNELTTGVENVNNTYIEDVDSRESTPTKSTTIETVIEADKDVENMSEQTPETKVKGTLTKMSSDEMDVITPFEERTTTPVDSDNTLKLLHSGEFHDVVLPTKVSRNDTSVVRGE